MGRRKCIIMADTTTPPVPNCNCTRTLLTVMNLRSDIEVYKTDVVIIHSVIAAVLVILVICVVLLFFWIRKLQRVINALDPMSKYKRVGPSVYVRKARRETSSISSSLKHFNANTENNIYSHPEDVRPHMNETKKKNEVGTLDRNFFTNSNFSFQNPLSHGASAPEQENSLNRRKISDPEVREAVGKLDNVIYL